MESRINILHMAALTGAYGTEKRLLNYLSTVKNTSEVFNHFVCAWRISDELKTQLDEIKVPLFINSIRGLKNILNFIEFVKANNIHILHSHNMIGHTLRNRIIPKLAGIPYIIEHEGGVVWDLNFTLGTKLTNSLVTANISNSYAGKILLSHKCGIDARVIHNGVKIDEISRSISQSVRVKLLEELGIAENRKIVGFIGRSDTPKGVHAFINMIPLVKQQEPDTVFLLVGDGPMREELEHYCKQKINSKDVLFLGYRSDVAQIMSILKLLVLPSIREPFANILLEAAAAKLPVVASNVDGVPEIVIDQTTGLLVNCTDSAIKPIAKKAKKLPVIVVDGSTRSVRKPLLPSPQKLAEAVVYLLQNPIIAQDMGEAAYKSVQERYSFDKYVKSLNDLYTQVAANELSK